MIGSIRNHPFAVDAHFESSLVLTYCFPKAALARFTPKHLQLDTYKDEYAFLAVALVKTTGLRPTGFPKFLGQAFTLIGYRIFVRYTNSSGKHLRGLYILNSETNKRRMRVAGNLFTRYNYGTTDISITTANNMQRICSQKSKFEIEIDRSESSVLLPKNSPFDSFKTARKFAGPLPYTFTHIPRKNQMLIVKGVRSNWIPEPVTILNHEFHFLHDLGLENAQLANAFEVSNIPYRWEKGIVETITE